MENHENFRITYGKGFQITFKNGITVSVQFGAGNYCKNHNLDNNPFRQIPDFTNSPNAEIAIEDNEGNYITAKFDSQNGQNVIGWCNTDKVMKALNWAQNYNGIKNK
jgi:hypothetical protein